MLPTLVYLVGIVVMTSWVVWKVSRIEKGRREREAKSLSVAPATIYFGEGVVFFCNNPHNTGFADNLCNLQYIAEHIVEYKKRNPNLKLTALYRFYNRGYLANFEEKE